MNFSQFMNKEKSPRIKMRRLDDEQSEITNDMGDPDTQQSKGYGDDVVDDSRNELELDSETKDDHSDERSNVIQRAMTALRNLDDFLEGNGAEDPEFGAIASQVKSLRTKLKTKLKCCDSPKQDAHQPDASAPASGFAMESVSNAGEEKFHNHMVSIFEEQHVHFDKSETLLNDRDTFREELTGSGGLTDEQIEPFMRTANKVAEWMRQTPEEDQFLEKETMEQIEEREWVIWNQINRYNGHGTSDEQEILKWATMYRKVAAEYMEKTTNFDDWMSSDDAQHAEAEYKEAEKESSDPYTARGLRRSDFM